MSKITGTDIVFAKMANLRGRVNDLRHRHQVLKTVLMGSVMLNVGLIGLVLWLVQLL